MAKKILIALGAVLAILILVIVTRPATFHIERSIVVAAPAENAFTHVSDFHAWAGWSPYDKLDPSMTRTFEGPASGVGAKYGWSGNDKAGEGRMTIEKADRPTQIAIELAFTKPFAATNTATFTFAPADGGTRVTWAMDGKNNFLAKAASLFMDIDKLVGADFERGLVALKAAAEKGPYLAGGGEPARK